MTRRRGRRALTDPALFVQKIWTLQGNNGGAVGFVCQKDWDTGAWDEVRTARQEDLPEMDRDWYFAPCLFRGRRRLREAAQPSRVLYADLDEVDPRSIKDVPPTLAWETSPGRYQGLWVVDRPMQLDSFENLNRRLTYHVGADKGGWSSTKVLRIPGTTSTKYGKSRAKRFTVQLIFKGKKYTVQDLHRLLEKEPGLADGNGTGNGNGNGPIHWGDIPDRDAVWKKWRSRVSPKARQLVRTEAPAAGDDRSARLYELEGLLLDAGMAPEEVLSVVRESAWNKYRGQRRELRQLRMEIAKHVEEKKVKEVEKMVGRVRAERSNGTRNGHERRLLQELARSAEEEGLPSLSYREFLDAHFPEPEWLVEGFWGRGAYGVWAGEFKAFKTVTLLDFAVSVASGQPFLGKFAVRHPGPVLYAFDEGTPGYIQDRLRRIAWQKGVGGGTNGNKFELEFPKDLALHLSPGPKLNLTDEESQTRLVKKTIARKPSVIILESFYLMAQDIDENSAKEVTPALTFLKELSQEYQTAVIISHHYNKEASTADGKKRRAGLRVSGSNVFGRWYESAVYLEREGDETEGRAIITAEHREQKGTGRQHLQVSMDTEDDVHYDVEIVDANILIGSSDTASSRLAAIDIPCPECGVETDVRCKDKQGKERVFHRERKEAAKNGDGAVKSQVDKILGGDAG